MSLKQKKKLYLFEAFAWYGKNMSHQTPVIENKIEEAKLTNFIHGHQKLLYLIQCDYISYTVYKMQNTEKC